MATIEKADPESVGKGFDLIPENDGSCSVHFPPGIVFTATCVKDNGYGPILFGALATFFFGVFIGLSTRR